MKRWSVYVIVALSLILAGVLLWIAYITSWNPTGINNQQVVISFETCAAAGNPVMESWPRQCRDPNTGITYTEVVSQSPTEQPSARNITSPKGVVVQLDNWVNNKKVTSPLTITGQVPGNWSFEASFPVSLTTSDGHTVVQAPASLQGDWMTTNMVPFTVTLTFDAPVSGTTGSLVLQKSNPSDLAANADSIEVPVQY